MEVPDETRALRRSDYAGEPRRNGPSTADLPQPVPPASRPENWVDFGYGALQSAVIFGCMIAGIIFLAFAIYNALCDPFHYFYIVLLGAAVYLVLLAIISIWTFIFGDRFSETDNESNAQSNNARSTRSTNNTNAQGAQPNNTPNARADQPNNDPIDRRDLIISRRESDATAADNFVRESITLDRIAEELQRERSVSGAGQSDFAQENQGSDRNAQGLQTARNRSRTGQSENSDRENPTANRNSQGVQEGRKLSRAGQSENSHRDSVTADRNSEGFQEGRKLSRTGQSENSNQDAVRNAQGLQEGRKLSRTGQSENSNQESDRNAHGFQEGRKLSSTGQSENSDRENPTANRNAQEFQEERKLSRTGQSENSHRDSVTADGNAQGFQEGRKLSRAGQSENSNQEAERNAQEIQAGRNLSRSEQSENSDREGLTTDRNAQEFQAGRNSLTGPGEPYRYQNDDVSNNRRTSGIETSTIYPPSKRRTRPTIPRVNEFQDVSNENWDLEHDLGQNQPQNTGEDNTWFSSAQQRNTRPYISSDFPACIAQSLRMNAPRCTATTIAAMTAAGSSIVQYEPQVITIALTIPRNVDGTNQAIASSSPTCRQPLTQGQQPTSSGRNCPGPSTQTNCVRIGQNNCSSISGAPQYCPQTCPSGTGQNPNLQQGQNFNSEGDRRIFHQPGPCTMNPNRPAENAFFSPGTDGYD